ncbi:MAG: hypothetical protein AAF431_18075 [Pseudomonadota bacterium]
MNRSITPGAFLLILTAFTSHAAFADELLERLENATEKLGKNQGQFYASRVPELKDKMPSWDWDDEIRQASKCVLDGIATQKGQRVAEAYVSGIERDAEKTITSFAQLSDSSSMPPELLGEDQTILNLMNKCRTMEISAVRLKESGFWDEMLKPEVMQKLQAD